MQDMNGTEENVLGSKETGLGIRPGHRSKGMTLAASRRLE